MFVAIVAELLFSLKKPYTRKAKVLFESSGEQLIGPDSLTDISFTASPTTFYLTYYSIQVISAVNNLQNQISSYSKLVIPIVSNI